MIVNNKSYGWKLGQQYSFCKRNRRDCEKKSFISHRNGERIETNKHGLVDKRLGR